MLDSSRFVYNLVTEACLNKQNKNRKAIALLKDEITVAINVSTEDVFFLL